jgi:hypothetical protein
MSTSIPKALTDWRSDTTTSRLIAPVAGAEVFSTPLLEKQTSDHTDIFNARCLCWWRQGASWRSLGTIVPIVFLLLPNTYCTTMHRANSSYLGCAVHSQTALCQFRKSAYHLLDHGTFRCGPSGARNATLPFNLPEPACKALVVKRQLPRVRAPCAGAKEHWIPPLHAGPPPCLPFQKAF